MTDTEDATRRRNAVTEYRKKLLQHKELESRVRSGSFFHNPTFTSLWFSITLFIRDVACSDWLGFCYYEFWRVWLWYANCSQREFACFEERVQ